MWQPGWEGSLGEKMDTCVCMAESLCCAPETIAALLIRYTPTENNKFKKIKESTKCSMWPLSKNNSKQANSTKKFYGKWGNYYIYTHTHTHTHLPQLILLEFNLNKLISNKLKMHFKHLSYKIKHVQNTH